MKDFTDTLLVLLTFSFTGGLSFAIGRGALALHAWRLRRQSIERRVQQSLVRLGKPGSRFARSLEAHRANSRDAAIVKEAQIQILQDFGREMRQAS